MHFESRSTKVSPSRAKVVVMLPKKCAGTYWAATSTSAVICLLLVHCGVASAGRVTLKNGLMLEGAPLRVQRLAGATDIAGSRPSRSFPYLMVDGGYQRTFVSRRQVADVDRSEDLGRYEKFSVPQRRTGQTLMLQTIGRKIDVTPFDEFGRRSVTVLTQFGEKTLIQGITEITPKYVKVEGLNEDRTLGLAPASLPPDVLRRILYSVIDPNDPDDRLAVARFYLQAGMYRRSAEELESIADDFPEMTARVDRVTAELRELQAERLLAELRMRKDAGQHRLAYLGARALPLDDMGPDVLRQVRELIDGYERARDEGETALFLLGELQANLADPGRVSQVAPMRSIVSEQLDFETLNRLDAFLKLADDESLAAADKLAIAYSGWLLGSAAAVTDLDAAIRLWDARFLIREFFRENNPGRRSKLVSELESIEGVGPEQVGQLIPRMPPAIDAPGIRPGEIGRVEVDSPDLEVPFSYAVLLPQEYNPRHIYPMIVTLRPAEQSTFEQVRWWGVTRSLTTGEEMPGQSQRHGYIVIAPEYTDEKQTTYGYGAAAHYIVLQSIRDARRRFNVDSDRVFLSGHRMGGDAAFDIGMSHPHVFAGVIPIGGMIDKHCHWYWQNARRLAWYVVGGELDRNSLERNDRELSQMMRRGFDVMYVEFIGRGYESFYSEIHRMFEWMNLQRRAPSPTTVEAKVLRPTDDRFYWVQAAGFPTTVTQADLHSGQGEGRVMPMTLEARLTPTNAIHISSGADRHIVWLLPEFIDFDRRVVARVQGQQKYNGFVRPEIATILEDVRQRGDRQRIYPVRLDLD